MADEADMQESIDSSVEQTTEGSQPETETQDSTETSTEEKGESTDTASTGEQKPSETQDVKPETKPVSRRSAAYRIQQLVKENDQLRKQVKPSQEQDEWEQPAQDDTQPNISELVAKEVEKRLNPIVSESTRAADDAEISELFSGKAEDRTKYEGQIRSLWNLPQYKDVAAQDIFNMLRGKEMEQTITQAKQQAIEEFKRAEREAKESSGSGSTNTSNRTGKGGKSINDMTDEEFIQHNERVKAGLA